LAKKKKKKKRKGFFARFFGFKKPGAKKRARTSRVPVSKSIALERRPRHIVKKNMAERVFVFYDKDDETVPDYRYHWYAVTASSRGEAREALRKRIGGKGSAKDKRMRGPLPQDQVRKFLEKEAPHELVTRLKG